MAKNLGPAGNTSAGRAAMLAAIADAKIEKQGFCNNSKPEVYACAVNVTVTMPGVAKETKQILLVQLTKGGDGKWKAVD